MEEFNVHNIRFYEYNAQAIHCLAYNNKSKLLALSRADCSIELWDCKAKPFKQDTYIGHKNDSIEALAWCDDRLFSAGLNGFIIEYNIKSFAIQNKVSVTGGPTWCLTFSPNMEILAAGTEDGYVCLFDVTEEGLLYNKTLKKQKSRILSIGWHPDSDHLVTGSVNFVHLVSTKTEKTLQFPVAKLSPTTDTVVWCVAILEDKTIITGDSRGKTCFWDGIFGTLINDLQTHQADVFTLQVASNSNCIYVSGVDPVIVEVWLVDAGGKVGKRKMWVKSRQRRIHTHDVRSLALTAEGKLFSGGIDTYLAFSFYPPKTAIKFPATPPRGYVSLAKQARCVLLGYEDRVELWRMGVGKCEDSDFLSIVEDRTKLVEISLKQDDRLEFCSVSPKAGWIAYCSRKRIKLYKFTCPQEANNSSNGSIEKVRFQSPEFYPSSQMLWLDETKFVSASSSNVLQVISITNGKPSVHSTLTIEPKEVVKGMSTSDNGSYLAVMSSNYQITIFKAKEEFKKCLMPRGRIPVTAFAITNTGELFITYSNMTMSEFSVQTSSCTPLGKFLMNDPSNAILKLNTAITNISFHSPNHIFLHTVSSFYVLKRKVTSSDERGGKMARYDREGNDSGRMVKTSANGMLSIIGRSNHILYFACLCEGNLISIESNPIKLLDGLPPTLKIKKFGAS